MNPIKWLIAAPPAIDDDTLARDGYIKCRDAICVGIIPRALCWASLCSVIPILRHLNDHMIVMLAGAAVYFLNGLCIALLCITSFYVFPLYRRFKKLRPMAKPIMVGHQDSPHLVYVDVPKGHRVVFTDSASGRTAQVVPKKTRKRRHIH